MVYTPSRDWSGDDRDCPVSRYSPQFKMLVDKFTRSIAELEGHKLPSVCPLCGRQGMLAIGKKISQIGNIYFNCRFCREVFDVCSLVMPPEMIAEIEAAREREVERWKSSEGEEAYLASISQQVAPNSHTKSQSPSDSRKHHFTPILGTPDKDFPSSLHGGVPLPSFEERLSQALARRPPQTPRRSTCTLDSSLPPSSIPSSVARDASQPEEFTTIDSDIEVGPIVTLQHKNKGTKQCPIDLLSPFITPVKTSSSSSSGKRKRTEELATIPVKKAKLGERVDALRKLKVVVWFKDDCHSITTEEIVPSVFSISDFTTVCDVLQLSVCDEFQVYYPNICGWQDPINTAVPIAHYPQCYDTIILRRAGIQGCSGFHSTVGCAFKD
ncbi:hypothetical protein BDY19DRAFT_993967 [Irpex rosettiformis]|uniref:Uncharacterized protein n=1 Tax=Irpex rosettiformis TaxID=378272 RepID=A0ACB8U2X5_9APHY|nr:hypothetical protein BDY19DRAFT_993967 [Irpex rosettiformis]